MPHPRPSGPSTALSTMLREVTSGVHRDAEAQPFMKAFFAGRLPRPAYIDWMTRQRHIYARLETHLRSLPADDPASQVVPPQLHRAARIEADLDHLTEGAWREDDQVSPATQSYLDRIDTASGIPAGIIVHAWLRYLGNVGGRDVLARLSRASTGLPERETQGISFTDFSGVGETRSFLRGFHRRLDALELSADDKTRLVAEADAGFRCNIALTDELAHDHSLA